MIVGLLRAAAVAALAFAAVAAPTEAKLHSSSLLKLGGRPVSHAAVQDAASFIMPYKDTTINMNWNTNVISTMVNGQRQPLLDDMKSVGLNSIVLAFATGECGQESWAGVTPAQLRAGNLDSFKAAGIRFRMSTGGAAGTFTCGSAAGFDAFIAGWVDAGLDGIDFDIEGGQSPSVVSALVDRVKEGLQKYPQLTFTFTVAVLAQSIQGSNYATPFPAGQAPDPFAGGAGATVMNALIAGMGFQQGNPSSWPSSKVRINPMAMDYGSASQYNCVLNAAGKCDMGQSAIQVAYNTNGHWGVPMSAIELTPMLGDNDAFDETFSLGDAGTVATWAKQNGIPVVHYWSYDRDTPCGAAQAQATCNTIPGAKPHSFATAFMQAAAGASHLAMTHTAPQRQH